MLLHVSLEERPIVVLGLRGGLLGANPIPHRLARGVQFSTDRAVWHEPDQFSSELNNIYLELYTVQRSVQRCVQIEDSIPEEALGAFGKSQTYSAEDIYKGRGFDRGRKQNRNKSKSKNIGEIKYR
ncbi:hypothetical protein Tco_1416538 [Tanacetum coccineum]